MTCPEENQLSDRTFTRRFAKEYIDFHSKILHDIKLPKDHAKWSKTQGNDFWTLPHTQWHKPY